MQTTQTYTNRKMDKQVGEYLYSKFNSARKTYTPLLYTAMWTKPRKIVKGKRPNTKGYTLHYFIYMKFRENKTISRIELIMVVSSGEGIIDC